MGYKDWTFDTLDVDEGVIKHRYPCLAKSYFEWHDIYETSFEREEYHLGINADVFPHVEELTSGMGNRRGLNSMLASAAG